MLELHAVLQRTHCTLQLCFNTTLYITLSHIMTDSALSFVRYTHCYRFNIAGRAMLKDDTTHIISDKVTRRVMVHSPPTYNRSSTVGQPFVQALAIHSSNARSAVNQNHQRSALCLHHSALVTIACYAPIHTP
jgi:hypothetical protein